MWKNFQVLFWKKVTSLVWSKENIMIDFKKELFANAYKRINDFFGQLMLLLDGSKEKYDKLIMDIGKSFREQIKG